MKHRALKGAFGVAGSERLHAPRVDCVLGLNYYSATQCDLIHPKSEQPCATSCF